MSTPNPVLSFQGISETSGVVPPDVGGFAGDSTIADFNNQGAYSFTRNGFNYNSKSSTQFWSGTPTTSPFDPRTVYDYISQRWFNVEVDGARSSSSTLLIGVSTNMDFSQGQSALFSIKFDPLSASWADYPQIGYNSKYVVVTVNKFAVLNNAFQGTNIYVFDRLSLLAGVLNYQLLTSNSANFCPSVCFDGSSSTEFLLARVAPGLLGVNSTTVVSRITGNVGAISFIQDFATNTSLVTWSSTGSDAPQTGSSALIDTGDDRIQNAVIVNGVLWYTHTIFQTLSNVSQVMWWQYSVGNIVLLNNQVISNASNFYCYPSIAVNKNNDAVIVFSQMNNTIFPSMLYVYKNSTDSSFRPPVLVRSGQSSYPNFRWGDYQSASVDPSDLQSFWLLGLVTDSFNNWQTWIAKIRPLSYQLVPKSDYFRQKRTQISTFTPSSANWNFYQFPTYVFGQSGDVVLNGKVFSGADDSLITWRPSNQTFYILPTVVQPFAPLSFKWGLSTDIVLTADIFGSGIDLLCAFRNGVWFFTDVYNLQKNTYIFGTTGDVPIVGDWLNLKRKQIGVWRPSQARFYFYDVVTGVQNSYQYGVPYPSSQNDIPLSGDFMGLGYDQIAIYRSSTGTWYVQNISNPSMFSSVQWGQAGDIPLEGDFDGSGKQSIAVYRPGTRTFFAKNIIQITIGGTGDIPLSGASVYNRMRRLGLL